MNDDPIKNFRNAFKSFLKEEKLEHKFKQKQLITNWEQIMGKTIASRTSKIFFKDKIMFLRLDSAPLKQEILNSKSEFLQLINRELGDGMVVEVQFI